MVNYHTNERDDRTENAENGDPYGVSPSEKEVWIESNFSSNMHFTFYPASKRRLTLPTAEDLYSEGVYSPEILSMSAVIPADVEPDEKLKIFAVIRNINGEYEVYSTSAASQSLDSLVLETEIEFMEWSELDGWEHHEISDSASFCAVELEAELGLLLMELNV